MEAGIGREGRRFREDAKGLRTGDGSGSDSVLGDTVIERKSSEDGRPSEKSGLRIESAGGKGSGDGKPDHQSQEQFNDAYNDNQASHRSQN